MSNLLGDEIKNLRQEYLILSQKKFADLLGTTQATVYRWETGRSKPSANKAEKLAQLRAQFKNNTHRDDARVKSDIFDWCRFAKSIRHALGKTQLELAVLLKTSVATVSNWETGRAKPSGEFIVKLEKMDAYIKKHNLRNTKAYQLKMKADRGKSDE